jgi:hypothetical protein
MAATYADHLVLGQGASREAIEALKTIAYSASKRDNGHPLTTWVFLLLTLTPDGVSTKAIVDDIRSVVVAYSRQAFDRTFEAKAVPERLQEPLRRLYREYRFDEHSKTGETSNALLLSDSGGREIQEFLFNRFTVTGSPEEVADRLWQIAGDTGIDRMFLSSISSQPLELARLAGERLFPRLPL